MDATHFDRLTRRMVVSVLGSASWIAFLDWPPPAAVGRARRKRCRKKKRAFCAGRCCPAGLACEAGACFGTCDNPFNCTNDGDNCAGNAECVCLTTLDGASGCFADIVTNSCDEVLACGPDAPCPSGQICAICNCPGQPNFRCFLPCPTS
jgi:hypothetical protein